MKKILLLTAFTFIAFLGFSQTLLQDSLGLTVGLFAQDVKETTVIIPVTTDDLVTYDIDVENTSTDSMNVWVKRYEDNVPTGSENYFCWETCFPSIPSGTNPVWVSSGYVTIPAQTVDQTFAAYYDPKSTPGDASFTFVWYLDSDHNDSTWVKLVFKDEWSGVGVEEDALANKITVSPNPVRDNFTIQAQDLNATYQVYDILGNATEISGVIRKNSTVVESSSLIKGVYFVRIKQEGESIAVKRFLKL